NGIILTGEKDMKLISDHILFTEQEKITAISPKGASVDGYEVIDLKLRDSYRNMKEKFIGHEEPIHLVEKAMKEVGLNFHAQAIRGGTDGAALTWNGV
ncbi:MAG: hypothetical protein II017_04150, partial [Erysipelotrichaceae bacterium]|nr:hypothetical protein [Erysipelotrichaceae bacterium]